MIGQNELIRQIERLIEEGEFPRFSIIVGDRGSGKKSLAAYIAGLMQANFVYLEDNSIASIRQVIDESYKQSGITVYRISDADSMSNEAQNTLLKVTEELPNNSYFIMTLEDVQNTLDTIVSRAHIFVMQSYSEEEIGQYAEKYYPDKLNIIKKVCTTPGDADIIVTYDGFYEYVRKVVENVENTALVNTFKIAEKIALKGEEDKYDPVLFFKAVMRVAWDDWNFKLMTKTSYYLSKLTRRSINKQMIFDQWLIDVQGE